MVAPFVEALSESFTKASLNVSVLCLENESDVGSLYRQSRIRMAIEFKNLTELMPSHTDSVEYYLHIASDNLFITNWEPYMETYRQEPNAGATTLSTLFVPLQTFVDSVITSTKTHHASVFSFLTRQFPNFDYSLDIRVQVPLLARSHPEHPLHLSHVSHLRDGLPHGHHHHAAPRRAQHAYPGASSLA